MSPELSHWLVIALKCVLGYWAVCLGLSVVLIVAAIIAMFVFMK